jgi:hypothetical protein
MERLSPIIAYGHRLLPFLPPLVVLIAILLIVREARHGIAELARLVGSAWADEWRGRERVSKCNRGGTIISFTLAIAVFIMEEVHSLFSSQHQAHYLAFWLFVFAAGFQTLSLLALAYLERQKMLLDLELRRLAQRARRPRRLGF